jgi:hypothetical protein
MGVSCQPQHQEVPTYTYLFFEDVACSPSRRSFGLTFFRGKACGSINAGSDYADFSCRTLNLGENL